MPAHPRRPRARSESVSVSPDGRRAVSGSYDKTLRVWDLETGACLRTLEGHATWVNERERQPRWPPRGLGQLMTRPCGSGTWRAAVPAHPRRPRDGVRSVSVSPDGRRAVSGSDDKTLRVWDLETGQCLRTLEGHRDGVSSVSVSPDGRRAVSGS